MNLNQLAQTVHAANKKWWQDPTTGEPIKRNKGELLALIHSEISEMADGEAENLMDDKLVDRSMGEVECVDAIIRLLDYSAGFGYDLLAGPTYFNLTEAQSLNDISRVVPTAVWNGISQRGVVLLHSHVSRVLELERKGKPAADVAAALVACLSYIGSYGGLKGYDLDGAYAAKMEYNRTREDHQHEARRIAGGKQF